MTVVDHADSSSPVAIVTGAAGGIGKAIARRLSAGGTRLIAADVDCSGAEETAKAIRATGVDAIAFSADVRDEEQVLALAEAARREFGTPATLVVANAGHQTFAPVDMLSLAEWDEVMDVNARGTFLTLRSTIQLMMETGLTGSAVAIASIQARLGSSYYSHYSASKAAVLSVVRSLALWSANHAIRVNAVAPGVIDTSLWAKADRELAAIRGVPQGVPRAERLAQVPLGRAGTPEDVAGAVAFLLSEDASYITGECIHVCGGDVML